MTVTKEVIRKVLPPKQLFEDCPYSPAVIKVNVDMANDLLNAREAIEVCNAQNQAGREWRAKNDR